MKSLFAILSLTLLAQATATAQLKFTGSFWDTADLFRLELDWENEVPQITFEGSPYTSKPPRPGEPDKEKRVKLTLKLKEEEVTSLRALAEHFSLCHSGYAMAIGTGLFVEAELNRAEDEPIRHAYFATYYSHQNANGRRMEDLPQDFHQYAIDGKVTEKERSRFFTTVDSLTRDLRSHRKALDLLLDAYQNDEKPDWEAIIPLVNAPYFSREEDREESETLTREAVHVIEALCADPPPHLARLRDAEGILVQLKDLSSSDTGTFGVHYPPYPVPFREGRNLAFFPPGLFALFADFIAAPDFHLLQMSQPLPYLSIPGPEDLSTNEDRKQRVRFLENAELEQALLPGSQNVQLLRLPSLEFENKFSHCLVVSPDQADKYWNIFLEVKDADWRILRTVEIDRQNVDPFSK